MKNIVKRNPYYRELPSGYTKLDAVGYQVLSDIKGLQIYDNPLLAAQNSTYNCKNVYTDDLGNLTIRPRLDYQREVTFGISGEILAVYKWRDTDIYLIYQENYSRTLLTCNTIVDGKNNYASMELDGKVDNIALQEYNDSVYTLVQYRGSLSLVKFSGYDAEHKVAGFGPVTGAINIIDPSDPDEQSYNILNNKGRVMTSVAPAYPYDETKFEVVYKLPVEELDINKPYRLFWQDERLFIFQDNFIFIFSGIITKIELPINFRYHFDENDWMVSYIAATSEVTVTMRCFESDPKANLIKKDNYQPYACDNTVASKIYYITIGPLNAYTLEFEKTAEKFRDTEIYHTLIPLYNGYYADFIPPERVDDDGPKLDIYHYADTEVKIGISIITSDFYKNCVFCWDEQDFILLQPGTFELYHYGNANFTKYSGNIYHYMLENFAELYFPHNTNSYIALTNAETGESDLIHSNSTSVLADLKALPAGVDINSLVSYDDRLVYLLDSTLYFAEKYPDEATSSFKPPQEFVRSNSIYSASESGNIWFKLEEQPTIYSMAPKNNYIEVERPTDQIPVLSDINERVITSFFLDNFYWFITEHCVFGTGVANGQFTIEFFDPLKYFKVTETITAAIRVSDSSFWIFHNNGAYLIYKTSYDEDVGVPRWLITSTAKSKGCDFQNAVAVLPATANIVSVTNDDISIVQMRENVQTDERILVPLSLTIQAFVRDLLKETESVKIGIWRYLVLFALKLKGRESDIPVLVYDSAKDNWWYWTFPGKELLQITGKDDELNLVIKSDKIRIYTITPELIDYTIGTLTYEIYTDYIVDSSESKESFAPIEWYWESALLTFESIIYRKQLLLTTFTFGDSNTLDENGIMFNTEMNFEYHFEIYSKVHSDKAVQDSQRFIQRVNNNICKTVIGSFMYLQLYLQNMTYDDELDFEALTKPQISCITFKYRTLPGDII